MTFINTIFLLEESKLKAREQTRTVLLASFSMYLKFLYFKVPLSLHCINFTHFSPCCSLFVVCLVFVIHPLSFLHSLSPFSSFSTLFLVSFLPSFCYL